MTRPVWHFAPGTPGGGLPREDITPKVLEAVLAMNATEDKNGCMYDDGNGQTATDNLYPRATRVLISQTGTARLAIKSWTPTAKVVY